MVKNIELQGELTITQLGKYNFKKPITFKIAYKENKDKSEPLYRIYNDDIQTHAYARSLSKAIVRLEYHLDGLIVAYLNFDDSMISTESKRIKEVVTQYLDLDDYADQFGE